MADAMARVIGPAYLSGSATTLYTVPGATGLTVVEWCFCNEDGVDRTITISIGADAGGKRIWKDANIPANGTLQVTTRTYLAAGEVIQGFASAANAVTVTVTGVLTT